MPDVEPVETPAQREMRDAYDAFDDYDFEADMKDWQERERISDLDRSRGNDAP